MKNLKNKKVLFITTKNLDYLRNTQEIEELEKLASEVKVLGSYSKNYLVRVLTVYWGLLTISMKAFDSVFVGFSPQLVVPVWFWKFRKNEVYIDFFISMYDTFVMDRKKFTPNSIVAKVFRILDSFTLKKANHVIADTKAHGNYFVEDFGVDADKIEVMYLKADTSIFYPREIEKRNNIKGQFDVLYFGSVLPLQGVEVVIEAAKILMNEKDIHFTIIGPIKDKMEKVESETIEYIDWLSQPDLATYIAMSDLCLAGHFNAEIGKAKRTIPGKAYIYEAMDKPMILGENEATHELYQVDDKHHFVEMGNARKLADKVLEIVNGDIG